MSCIRIPLIRLSFLLPKFNRFHDMIQSSDIYSKLQVCHLNSKIILKYMKQYIFLIFPLLRSIFILQLCFNLFYSNSSDFININIHYLQFIRAIYSIIQSLSSFLYLSSSFFISFSSSPVKLSLQLFILHFPKSGAYEGQPRPPQRLRGGTHEGGSFNITSACISLPQARHSGPPGSSRARGTAPPWKIQN